MSGLFSKPPTPDYSQMAAASERSAELAAGLGQQQIDLAKSQFDQNMQLVTPIVQAQAALMQQQLEQGQDYYDYSKSFRPLEQDMLGVAKNWADQLKGDEEVRKGITGAMTAAAGELKGRAAAFDEASARDLALFTGSDKGITDLYGDDIEREVGQAVGDARVGQSRAQADAIRQALRFGINVDGATAATALAQGSQQAAAANMTRRAATDRYRQLLGEGIGMRQSLFGTSQAATADALDRGVGALRSDRDMRIQDEAIKWGRAMDVTGLGRGMVGASQGAYGLAVSSGNSAVANQMQPGNSLLQGINMGTNTIMGGRQLLQNGLGNVLNAQTSVYNNSGSGLSDLAGLVGTGVGAYAKISSRAYKRRIERIGTHPRGIGVYSFEYREPYAAKWGRGRQVGVMADEVLAVLPEAVSTTADGLTVVDYSML